MSYLRIAKKHPQYLTYGALHYFFSSIGQTFLISVSVPYMLEDLQLSSMAFSNSYAIATICSALTLPLVGGWVDRAKFTTVSFIGGLGLILACVVMFSSHALWVLIPGLFLIRFFGQGGMVLIGSTAIAKFFNKNRGKALSLAGMGLASAETFMPLVVVSLIGSFGWRESWLFLGAAVALLFLPLTNLLIKKHNRTQEDDSDSQATTTSDGNFTRTQVLKDPKFYLILPAFIFLPFFITGIFIHQNLLAASKGWTMEWMAFCFIGYGVAKVVMSFLGGALIDRFSGRQVFIFYLVPLGLGLMALLLSDHKLVAMLYMILLGMTASLGSLTGVAIWAELYGVKNLGAIKSMVTTFMVISTALGPIVIGYGIEKSTSITLLGSIFAIFGIISSSWWVIQKKSVVKHKKT